MENELIYIGQRISNLLDSNDEDRKDLADVLGIGVGAIGRYIRGEADAGAIGLAKIASHFSVTLDWLITGHETIYTGKMFFNDNPQCVSENLEYYAGQRLSDDERQMLNLFRKLDMREYGSAMRALELIVETSKYPLKNKDLPIKP